uniref:Serpentine receptor class gamma n=1 Tax=Parastrongyloides trichosuri TaxID=131310 RepID=A0A0N4Z0L8_PARTI
MLVEFLISMRMRKYAMLPFFLVEGSWQFIHYPKISTIFHYFIKIEIYLCHVSIVINRFISVYLPFQYDNIWSTKNLIRTVILIVIIPLPYVVYLSISQDIVMWYEYSSAGILRLNYNKYATNLTSLVDGISCIFSGLICFVMYAIIISIAFRLWQNHKKVSTSPADKKNNYVYGTVHFKLSLISAVLFLTLLLNTVCQCLTFYAQSLGATDVILIIYDISYPVMDILYGSSPYILFLTCKDLRTELIGCIKINKGESSLKNLNITRNQNHV